MGNNFHSLIGLKTYKEYLGQFSFEVITAPFWISGTNIDSPIRKSWNLDFLLKQKKVFKGL